MKYGLRQACRRSALLGSGLCSTRDMFLKVEYPNDVIDICFVDGESSVLGCFDVLNYVIKAVVYVDAYNLVARHHNVIDGDFFQVKDAD